MVGNCASLVTASVDAPRRRCGFEPSQPRARHRRWAPISIGLTPRTRSKCLCQYFNGMGLHPDLGNVPSWIGAGSLLLAFRIFLRDRTHSDRAQVDAIGIWGVIRRIDFLPVNPRNDDIEFQIKVRNAKDLPVEVHHIAFTFDTRWLVPWEEATGSEVPVRDEQAGKPDVMRFLGPIGIPPQETWESQWFTVNLTHAAPAADAGLSFLDTGVKTVIVYALVVENAGIRWESRQRQGKPAKRIRWYSRSGAYYPADWQNPNGRRLRIAKARATVLARRFRNRSPSRELSKG